MKYKILFSLFFAFPLYAVQLNTCIDLSKNGIVSLLQSMWPAHQIINDQTVRIITEPGSYHVLENLTSEIIINASDVIIDLNGFTLSGDAANLITINTGQKNILIKNGTIIGTANGTNNGIYADQDSSQIFLQNLRFATLQNGVYFDGAPGAEITCCKIIKCVAQNCAKGFFLNHVARSLFQHCKVCGGFESSAIDFDELYVQGQAGFYLQDCSYNKFKHCMVIRVGNTEPGKSAVGYFTKDGVDNLFYECFAEGIHKGYNPTHDEIYTSSWCNKAIGFLFTGTETESKILDCLVDSITSTSWAHSFGINLDMTLNDTTGFEGNRKSFTFAGEDSGLFFNDFAWSPRCGYLGVASIDISSSNNSYSILKFDGAEVQTIFTSDTSSNPTEAIAWSNCGRYLAAVRESNISSDRPEINVLDVDTEKVYQFDFGPDSNSSVTDVAWFHHSKRFVTVGPDGNTGDLLIKIFRFNPGLPGGEIITELVSYDAVGTGKVSFFVAISPDDKYIAVGDVGERTIMIYSAEYAFPNELNEVAIIQSGSGELRALEWNPVACCGKYYLAIGGVGTVENPRSLGVLEFLADAAQQIFSLDLIVFLEFPEGEGGAQVSSVTWSPNGKYLAAAGRLDPEGSPEDDFLGIFGFNPQRVEDKLVSLFTGELPGTESPTLYHVDWSPCGKYIGVAGGSDLNLEIFEVATGVTKCLVDGNKVANCISQICSIGILGGSFCNCITRNVCYQNCINFSQGVYNVFYNGLAGEHGVQGNWSIPPY